MRRSSFLLMAALAIACGRAPDAAERTGEVASRFTSREATLLDFEFDGAIATEETDPSVVQMLIRAQLMYTVGELNADRSVGRASSVAISAIANGLDGTFRYHAKLPVGWGQQSAVPTSYMLTLPRGATLAEQDAFAAKYGATCVDPEAGPPPVDRTFMFLHFRPYLPSCVLDPSDVVTVQAKVTPSTEVQTGKYPEYDRIWDDKTLNVVALFSRADTIEATGDNDEGARAYAQFLDQLRQYLDVPGDAMPVVKTLADGRTVRVDARMVEHALDASPDIDTWYSARTAEADLILYNGHAGFGANVRSLMQKGQFRAGKYLIFSLNACDTFAYLDDTLAKRRAMLNPDDPAGTKYMDVISNVMPGYFGDGPLMSMTLIRSAVDSSVTYDDILARLDPAQAANVTGEEDNSFVPSEVPSSPPPDHVQSTPVPAGSGELPSEVNEDLPAPTSSAGWPHTKKSASCNAVPGQKSSEGLPVLLLLAWAAARRKRGYAVTA
jgi:hypothetical protein